MLRKMITGSNGISGIPTMLIASSTMSGRSSSQQRKPTVKLRTGLSNMANPTLRIRSGHIRRTTSPIRYMSANNAIVGKNPNGPSPVRHPR
ncbi:MAG: hypothetical protein E6J82_05490 [Deltaproteobacteria bacterium]|nr:MAG: hypothetical protein E6J82_05490 [Deltaproteobacteria bacterium]